MQFTTDVIATSTAKSTIVLKKLLFPDTRGASKSVLSPLHEKEKRKDKTEKKQVQVLWRVFATMTHIK